MAVDAGYEPVTTFEQWYKEYDPTGGRDGGLEFRGMAPCADHVWRQWQQFKREMDLRVENYDILEKLADGEVISPKPDLPNVSSGETAGLVRRIARNLVQNTPNVEVISKFDDDSVHGIFSRHILTAKIIGTDQYSNDMQQNLFSSTKTALTLGFSCVIPVLLQDAAGGWYIKYDTVHYRDVFPEDGCKDVRTATCVYVRRYLTRGEVKCLIRDEAPGWDVAALKLMMKSGPFPREMQSVDHQTKKHHQVPNGYEIITRYSSSGDPFLTFAGNTKLLLRIERNTHPLKWHPVHFLVLEKDDQQPLGKSQVELLIGRQDFQDLMLNGAMKLWYRNINPSIIGYGTVNSIPNLSPGKYTQIANPNAKVEPFEVNTQTLMQYGSISQQNLGSMVMMVGAADQQMAMQNGAPGGMSATPQGVEAQQQMVDITTNNYQKSIEAFFSHYCSYALTIYFQELRTVKKVAPTADARIKLLEAGLPVAAIEDDGTMSLDFDDMATEYWVRCVPGSLVELEDEKQLRILNQMFIPLSQAMPAMAATQDQTMLKQAAKAMQYIIGKQIELSGATSAKEIGLIWKTGDTELVNSRDARIAALEESIGNYDMLADLELDEHNAAIAQLQQQMHQMAENQQLLLEKLGVMGNGSAGGSPSGPEVPAGTPAPAPPPPSLLPASA
jgi:uncharacterized coiled-coil protein SlyX